MHTLRTVLLAALLPFLLSAVATAQPVPAVLTSYEKPPAVTPPQVAPTAEPQLFGEGIFSTPMYELTPAFTPDGKTAYTTLSTPSYGDFFVIVVAQYEGGQWTEPEVASFSGQYSDADPFIAPDGSALYYLSKRPVDGTEAKEDFDVWKVERTADGWSEPIHLGDAVNTDGPEYFPTVDAEGTLYFASAREGGEGRGDIYRAERVDGAYPSAENLGPAVNTKYHDTTPAISPDGTTLVFGAWRPGGEGSGDLYVSRYEDGAWAEAQNLGPRVNSPGRDYCPILGRDGETLYFTSSRGPSLRPAAGERLRYEDVRRFYQNVHNGMGNAYVVSLEE
jgi:hypothetical protein